MLTKCLIFWITYLVTASNANVAPFIKPCRPLDSKCILDSAKIALPYFAKGVEELGIPPMEPLAVKDVSADTGDLKMSFRNMKVHQLSKCEFDSITRDPVKSTANIKVHCPLTINGNYTLSGKLFFLEIEGDGGVEIKGGIISVIVDLKLKSYKNKNGKKHYKISGFDYKYDPISKFDVKFENLYNGDKERAAPIEQILSDSWRELILDIGQPVMKEGILGIANVIDKMLKAVPADEMEIV